MAVEFRPGDDEAPSGATVSYFPGVGPDAARAPRRAGGSGERVEAPSAATTERPAAAAPRSATGTRSAARGPLRAVEPVSTPQPDPTAPRTPPARTARARTTDDEGWAAEPRADDREFVQKMRDAIAAVDAGERTSPPPDPATSAAAAPTTRTPDTSPATGPVRALGVKRAVAFVESSDDLDDDLDDDETSEPEPVDPAVRLAELDLLVVRKLARRAYSEWEVAEVLRGNGAEPHEVEHLLEEFRRRGYLDDAALAEQLVESLHTRKGQSRSVIARELSSKRIDQAIIQLALEAIDDDDELERALVVARKRAGQLSSYDSATAERRLTAYLSRRGYGSSIVREACKQALSGTKRPGVSFR